MPRRKTSWRILVSTLVVGTLLATLHTTPATAATFNGERLDFTKKMSPGTNIGYKIFPGNEYTSSIPAAINSLMYPPGSMSNPMVLWQTTVTANSQMDFYQYSKSASDIVAYVEVFRKDDNGGGYYSMGAPAMDAFNWRYAEVWLNDARMDELSTTKRRVTILHEMLHGYGLRDLKLAVNKASIMYAYTSGTATAMTAETNTVLVTKY
ncbi:MAG: hypothetical protein QM591_09515 [Microbacterium sp.]